jgi:hypothetical protein
VSAWADHADLTTAKPVYVHPSAADLEQDRDTLNTCSAEVTRPRRMRFREIWGP